jgi:hypothetical protein
MKNMLIFGALFALFAISISAQASECPAGYVCITKDAAIKALQDSDKVAAQGAEISTKDQAIADLRQEISKMQIELAKTVGELTGAEKQIVRCEARTDVLLKYVRPKKIGLINF